MGQDVCKAIRTAKKREKKGVKEEEAGRAV